jgi:DNA modification methylase
MTAQLYQGDCIETMRGLPDGCVQTCVTSPPYYGLRDYGTATWEGGSAECDHRKNPEAYSDKAMAKSTIGAHSNTGHAQEGYKNVCGKCGAKRIDNQIGLEDTPDAYVAKLVDVFREVRRLLRDDGTLWLNLGDSYAATSRGTGGKTSSTLNAKRDEYGDLADDRKSQPWMDEAIKFDLHAAGLKPKDLIGIPWLVAFALRADGWYLRSDIIWHKPNPMPESVTDRPTKSHEYIFLLSKSREYFYDADAIREPLAEPTGSGGWQSAVRNGTPDKYAGRYLPNKTQGAAGGSNVSERGGCGSNPNGRNKRSVWTVTTKPYAEAHFATFPPDLIEPCILAGTSAHGCCAKCGAVWERQVEYESNGTRKSGNDRALAMGHSANGPTAMMRAGEARTSITVGWQPTCTCNADVVPCTVLDPFNGSGTTGAVSLKHGRKYIGCELNPEYIELAHRRIERSQPMLLEVPA